MNKKREKKYLVIGSSGHQYVDCIDWNTSPLPNFLDYDVIIVNVRSMSPTYLAYADPKEFEKYREILSRYLFSKGTIIILSDQLKTHKNPNHYPEYRTNYSWCPLDLKVIEEAGDTIDIRENRFPKYYSHFHKWECCFSNHDISVSSEISKLVNVVYKTQYRVKNKIFIKNRYGVMLSGLFYVNIHYQKTKSSYFDVVEYYDEEPDITSGDIVVLPLIEDVDDRVCLNLLLEDIIGKPQTVLPPVWIDKVPNPIADKTKNKIVEIEKKINHLISEKEELENEFNNYESYKKLLYTDGKELEEIFKVCLQELGGNVTPAKYSNEEYCLEFDNDEFPIEAKGVSKSIALTHLRQLIDYSLKYEEATGKKCKGILLGNPWKNTPVDQRNTNDKPYFPDNVIRRANELNISLVSSVDFFYAFCIFLENESIGKKILKSMTQSNGICEFSDLK